MTRDGSNIDYILPLEKVGKEDTEQVGGKSSNLGELEDLGVPVLPGFTTTSKAYTYYINRTGIKNEIKQLTLELESNNLSNLKKIGKKIRTKIKNEEMPKNLKKQIKNSYNRLSEKSDQENVEVAVRSSATAEDLPNASFAGQQETYLNISGEEDVIEAVKRCYASLFTDRAISYREHNNFDHFDVKLSCTIQKMASADNGGGSGVMFTLDPDSGFDKVVTIEAIYGLGELAVQGEVNPDRYTVFKPKNSIIERKKGDKKQKMVSTQTGNRIIETSQEERESYVLETEEIEELTEYAKYIENHYDKPMDIEWVYDSDMNQISIVQARPETVHSTKNPNIIETHELEEDGETIIKGAAIGDMISSGTVRHLKSPEEMEKFNKGDVLVTDRTDPDWEPIMKKASGIITDKGGKTSHAAIVSRELGVPTIVGAGNATEKLEEDQKITIDCTSQEGRILEGDLNYDVKREHIENIPDTDTDIMLILGNPSSAFKYADLPVDGVGLAREEFIISSHVGKHPLKLIEDGEEEKFVESLRSGIGKIAAAFYPKNVIVRLSDFKTDEYRGLEGGKNHEEVESNPMLGWRGASRYYDEKFSEAFKLECKALKQITEGAGLDNITLMVPFCRTPEEGKQVLDMMEQHGLSGLETFVMAELPSNIMLADEFSQIFDGFSIGSNDLTQLTLGVDRNSEKMEYLFDENHRAVKRSIQHLVNKADTEKAKIGICGDAPSTIDGYAEFLVKQGVDSISVSPDVTIETILKVAEAEKEQQPGKISEVARNSYIDQII